ncbi:DUF881 domain-containing protein [Terracoccus sp. 273MFTsu3.1]|uniref:DUF881 domain-containing protein n=1 Tax=Terracoccus sp. 273MFTsu3.1 TaxID=1172188 RepID=UPI0003695A8C|nr:DUF881 domain-containing protein [Terracoccus sp. 273MFTsu3.1]
MTDAEQPEPPVHAESAEQPESATAGVAGVAGDSAASPGPSRRRPRLTWGLLVPVVMASAGVMFAMSFQTAQGRDLRADRDLPQLIMEGDSRVAEKASVLDGLQKEVEALSKTNAPTDEHLSSLTRAADELAAPAATTKVRGAALEVTLDDAKRTADSLPDGFTADDIVVHQQDVQAVVNALWTSGAEAMMIQDQRVISTSAVRCVGNTLILQGRVYAPPYRITAIGDVDRMQQGLDADASVNIYKQYVDAVGLGYALHTHASIEFPAYSGSVDFQYASPIR